MIIDKQFLDELERAESEYPDDTDRAWRQEQHDHGVLDADGQPVRLNYFLILETPNYSVSPTGILGGEDVPLIRYAGQGCWLTPHGRVRAKDVWDVRPARGQGPFKLMVPWRAQVFLPLAQPQLKTATVVGWDGEAWITDIGSVTHVQFPIPAPRTIDDQWQV